jgi:hypothetical protein
MNAKLSIASEIIQHRVHEHFHKRDGEIQKPIGIGCRDSHVVLLPCPDGGEDPYKILRVMKECNATIPSDVCGMACEVFMQTRESIDGYKYGDLNDSNSESAILLHLQERHSKERYFAIGKLNKSDNSIIEWIETKEGCFGGDLADMDLY